MKRAVFIVNRPDYLLSHRLGLVLELKKSGYEVHVMSVFHESSKIIEQMGCKFHAINMKRGGTNPFSEMFSILKCCLLIRRLSPEILHCITLKPVFYGAFIGKFVHIPKLIVSIAGLGSVFTTNSFKNNILRFLIVKFLKFGFCKEDVVAVFQNNDDRQFFVDNEILNRDYIYIIPGSGVDLLKYNYAPMPHGDKQVVLLPARLIAEKGVLEYINAAQVILKQRDDVEFWLAGEPDFGNPSSLNHADLHKLGQIDGVRLIGHRTDMDIVLAQSSVVVLPSYREGFPKALIEAAAVGRPIVTTDVPGCRDAVIPGVTGFLVPLKSVDELVDNIKYLLNNRDIAEKFGLAARKLAEEKFDVKQVTAIHREIYGLEK